MAVAVLAGAVCLSTVLTSFAALRPIGAMNAVATRRIPPPGAAVPRFGVVIAVFSATSLASAAFATTMVPAFVDRGFRPTTAAMLGGVLGLMQLPGRVMVMNGTLASAPGSLLIGSLVLQGVGLAMLAVAPSVPWATAGVALFAAGAGLTTIIRPHFVQSIFGMGRAGHLNGLVARAQQFARAAAPVLTVGIASVVGYGMVFALLAAVFVLLAVGSRAALSDLSERHVAKEAS
jgi:hypothetical protein